MMASEVGSGEDVTSSCLTGEINLHQKIETDRKPPSTLPSPPNVHSTIPSPGARSLSDQAYLQAAAIFRRLCVEKPAMHQLLRYEKTETPLSESGDKTAEQQAFQLAFSTLKCLLKKVLSSDQDLLEDIMIDSSFHISQHIASNLLPLAMVMLFDFQDRKFLLHERSSKEDKEQHQDVRDLESILQRYKTKLAASIARCRVKNQLRSLSCIFSDAVRTKHQQAKALPLYAWVNTLQTSTEKVCEELRHNGLWEMQNIFDIRESMFCRDGLCPDTLVFSQNFYGTMLHSSLTTSHVLNFQDRSLCLAVSVLRPLLFDNDEILVAGSFSALTVAHVAVAAAASSGSVLVCGADHTPSQLEEMQNLLTEMDIKNVKVLSQAFCGLSERDSAVQHLKVVMVLPQCSSSALSDPVPTIYTEHGDLDLLKDLSRGSVSQSKIQTLSTQQARLLAHALTFPKVQTVVYCTRSLYPEENEQLVEKVLQTTHVQFKRTPFRVDGPVLPGDVLSKDTDNFKFFRIETSKFTNGCFIAQLSRQVDPTRAETVQDVLARAVAKGLLSGIIPEGLNPAKKEKTKRRYTKKHKAKTGKEVVSYYEEGGVKEAEMEKTKVKIKKRTKTRKINHLKRRKIKHPKQTQRNRTTSKHTPMNHKKKPAKKKRPMKSKTRRIPRLTLKLMSSTKTSGHRSSQAVHQPSPVHSTLHLKDTPTMQVVRREVPESADSKQKEGSSLDDPVKKDGSQEDLKPADSDLPIFTFLSFGSLSSGSTASNQLSSVESQCCTSSSFPSPCSSSSTTTSLTDLDTYLSALNLKE